RFEHADPGAIGIGAVLPADGARLLAGRRATALTKLIFRAHGVAAEGARRRLARNEVGVVHTHRSCSPVQALATAFFSASADERTAQHTTMGIAAQSDVFPL